MLRMDEPRVMMKYLSNYNMLGQQRFRTFIDITQDKKMAALQQDNTRLQKELATLRQQLEVQLSYPYTFSYFEAFLCDTLILSSTHISSISVTYWYYFMSSQKYLITDRGVKAAGCV